MPRVFLQPGESFTGSQGAQVVGNAGLETIGLLGAGYSVDANVDRVELPGALSSYSFQVQGNQVLVRQGVTLVAQVLVQDDADGTALAFSDGSAALRLAGLNQASLGGQAVGVASASSYAGGGSLGSGFNAADPARLVGGASTPVPPPTSLQPMQPTVPATPGSTGATGSPDTPNSTNSTDTTLWAQAQRMAVKNLGTGATATLADPNVRALDEGSHWARQSLSFGFNTSVPADYNNYRPGLFASNPLTSGWKPLNEAEKAVAREALAMVASFTALSFTEVSGNGGDIRFNSVTTAGNTAGFSLAPDDSPSYAGDVFLSNQIQQDTTTFALGAGGQGRFIIVHEIGHALGLKHPFEGSNNLPAQSDDPQHTVMTYSTAGSVTVSFAPSGSTVMATQVLNAYPAGYSLLDVQALQAFYGPNLGTNTGDTIYRLSGKQPKYLTVWDAGGTDTLDASGATGECRINLNGGTLSSVDIYPVSEQINDADALLTAAGRPGFRSFITSQITQADQTGRLYKGLNNLGIVQGALVEHVVTGAGNDTIIDNPLDNQITTGAGDDRIELGRGGFDTVAAGSGVDTVVLNTPQNQVQLDRSNPAGVLLVGQGYAAWLSGVEQLSFTDGLVSLVA